MSYLGAVEQKSSDIRRINVTSSTSATHTLTWVAPSEQSLIVTINGIKQQNNYTVSGTTLTLDTALVATDAMEVVGILDIGETNIPADNSITTDMIQDDVVTADKLANSINTEIAANTAKVTNATHTGDVTGATALTIATDAVDIPMLSATGTADATTFLRGDNSWTAISEYDDSGLQDDIAILGFKVAANGSLAKYDLVDQTIDDFQDASGIDASASTNEVRDSSGKYYVGEVASSGNATGGTESTHGSYKVHTFLSDGNLVVPSSGNVSALVVAGGGASIGGGSQAHSAGGGAGGVRAIATHAVTAQTYAVTIGAGGTAMSYGSVVDADMEGKDSVFDTITSTGGGRGGQGYTGTDARQSGTSGGSGGGAGDGDASVGSGNTPSTSPSQGNSGGSAAGTHGSSHIGSGGGGGAGAVGGAGHGSHPNMSGGDGGDGVQNDYRTGSNVYYGGGGGGSQSNPSSTSPGTEGSGGQGGGGTACRQVGSVSDGTAGTANTGGGGGGGGYDGGSGIVVIRYTNNQFTTSTVGDLTLVSNATTAQAVPTKGDIVMTYTDASGTATLNTDLKAYSSRDNGSTYTQMTLASEGTTGGHKIVTAHNVDISSQPSGSSMRYKIETLNQSAGSKETRIQAVSLGWS